MPSIPEILYEISHINEDSVPRWIGKGLNSLTPETLQKAVDEWQDPLLLAEYLNLEHPLVKVAAKYLLKKYWERVERTLTDYYELYNQLSKDPAKKKILDTPRGQAWLVYVRKRCYDYYFKYTWD